MKPLIETASGRRILVDDPAPADINIFDIAHGLAMTCRWGGQCTAFYSVAEHAVLVHGIASAMAEEMKLPQHIIWSVRLAALHHDSAEAYLGDLIRPVRRWIGQLFESLHERWQSAIYQHLGLSDCERRASAAIVNDADEIALFWEAQKFMPFTRERWPRPPALGRFAFDHEMFEEANGPATPALAKALFTRTHEIVLRMRTI